MDEVEHRVGGGEHSLQTGKVCIKQVTLLDPSHFTVTCTAGQSKPSSWKDEPEQEALLSAVLMCGMPGVP